MVKETQLKQIEKLFKCENDQERIIEILKDNHINNFKNYYCVWENTKDLSFVNEFYPFYKLDIQIRRNLFSSIGRFEISLKTKLAIFLEEKFGENSIWNKRFYDSEKIPRFISSINRVTKRMSYNVSFTTKKHRFFDGKGQEIFFSNYEALRFATLGNTIHLIFSLKQKDKEEFCKIYFNDMDFQTFEKYLGLMNSFRNYVAHLGEIVNKNAKFPNKENKEFTISNFGTIDNFINIYTIMTSKTATKSFIKETMTLFKGREQYLEFYGFSLKEEDVNNITSLKK